MRALLDTFWAPKHGNSLEEYEDAFAPASGGELEGSRLRFAVADGATEAVFSRIWAELLVRGYRKGLITGRTHDTRNGLARLGRVWQRRVGGVPLPWYGEEKRRQGAFAALVGLEVSSDEPGDTGTWRSYAVGDCCLFHLRGDRLLGSFPVEDPEDFGSRPTLLCSNMNRNAGALDSAAIAWGEWAAGDVFCLASDALAAWLLGEHLSGDPPWRGACELGTTGAEDEFAGWISHLRAERGLHNDDVTLLRIALSTGASAPQEASTGG